MSVRDMLDADLRAQFQARYQDTVRRLAANAPREVLLKALGAPDEVVGLATALAATAEMPPPRDLLAPARLKAIEVRKALLEDAGGGLSVGEVARLLQLTTEAVQQRRRRNTLLAVPGPGGRWLFPAFQFESPQMLGRLPMVLDAFRVDEPWSRLSVLLGRAPSLGGRRPVDALREGDVEGAWEAVASYGPDS